MRRIYKNKPEEAFCKWIEAQGFYPIKRGWPDFFCKHPVTGRVIFVEVKPEPGEYLKVEQYVVMEFLIAHGIECYRWDPITKILQPIKSRRGKGEQTTHQSSDFGNAALEAKRPTEL